MKITKKENGGYCFDGEGNTIVFFDKDDKDFESVLDLKTSKTYLGSITLEGFEDSLPNEFYRFIVITPTKKCNPNTVLNMNDTYKDTLSRFFRKILRYFI